MNRSFRKFVAVLMLLWLPLFGTGAVAASISMEMRHGACEEVALPQHLADGSAHQHHHTDDSMIQDHQATADEPDSSCNSCGVCHFACSSYLAAPVVTTPDMQAFGQSATPYLVVFSTVTSVPLLPPPLACA